MYLLGFQVPHYIKLHEGSGFPPFPSAEAQEKVEATDNS